MILGAYFNVSNLWFQGFANPTPHLERLGLVSRIFEVPIRNGFSRFLLADSYGDTPVCLEACRLAWERIPPAERTKDKAKCYPMLNRCMCGTDQYQPSGRDDAMRWLKLAAFLDHPHFGGLWVSNDRRRDSSRHAHLRKKLMDDWGFAMGGLELYESPVARNYVRDDPSTSAVKAFCSVDPGYHAHKRVWQWYPLNFEIADDLPLDDEAAGWQEYLPFILESHTKMLECWSYDRPDARSVMSLQALGGDGTGFYTFPTRLTMDIQLRLAALVGFNEINFDGILQATKGPNAKDRPPVSDTPPYDHYHGLIASEGFATGDVNATPALLQIGEWAKRHGVFGEKQNVTFTTTL